MKKLLLVTLVIGGTLLAACAQGATTSPSPSPKPTTPTSSPSPTPSPTPKPTAAPKPTATQTGAPVSFAGKTITVVVPFAPGGGTDLMGRFFAKHFPRFLPGNPGVIVRNMPGGDGTIGGNYAYGARPDGLTLMAGGGGVSQRQLVGTAGLKYDLLKMTLVASAPAAAVFIMGSGIIQKPEDITKAKGLVFGGSGATAQVFIMLKELVDIPTERVTLAYSGTGDALRALLSREINMAPYTTTGFVETIMPHVKKGDLMVLAQSGLVNDKGDIIKDPSLPADIITGKELYVKVYGKEPSGMAWDAYKAMVTLRAFEKIVMLPPGTPDNIARVYWDAVTKMKADAEFKKDSEKIQGEVEWGTSPTNQESFRVNFASAIDPKIVEWIRNTLQTKYGVVLG